MFASLGRVVPSHLLDHSAWDFAGLRPTGTPFADGDRAFDPDPELERPSVGGA